eukprot:6371262-Amphidinium_carterae.1
MESNRGVNETVLKSSTKSWAPIPEACSGMDLVGGQLPFVLLFVTQRRANVTFAATTTTMPI